MTNKMTTSGSRALVPGVRCPIPSPASISSALKPRRGCRRARGSGGADGERAGLPPALMGTDCRDKEPQLHPTCAESLFSKALSDGFTSLRALLKDVKISNHHKVNISKLAFQNPSHFQKSLEFHLSAPPTSFALLGLECFSLI